MHLPTRSARGAGKLKRRAEEPFDMKRLAVERVSPRWHGAPPGTLFTQLNREESDNQCESEEKCDACKQDHSRSILLTNARFAPPRPSRQIFAKLRRAVPEWCATGL